MINPAIRIRWGEGVGCIAAEAGEPAVSWTDAIFASHPCACGVAGSSPVPNGSVVPLGCISFMVMESSLYRGWSRNDISHWCRPIRLVFFRHGRGSVQDTEHHWHEEQGGDRGHDKTANHRAAQGCVLLTAFAQPEGHRYHTDNHCHRCHQD